MKDVARSTKSQAFGLEPSVIKTTQCCYLEGITVNEEVSCNNATFPFMVLFLTKPCLNNLNTGEELLTAKGES